MQLWAVVVKQDIAKASSTTVEDVYNGALIYMYVCTFSCTCVCSTSYLTSLAITIAHLGPYGAATCPFAVKSCQPSSQLVGSPAHSSVKLETTAPSA